MHLKSDTEYIMKTEGPIAADGTIPMRQIQELVRCKDCKHRKRYPCDEIEYYECAHMRYKAVKLGVDDDFFCADGERE